MVVETRVGGMEGVGSGEALDIYFLIFYLFFKRFYLFIFREKGREKERKRNTDVREVRQLGVSHMPAAGNLAHNPGRCPDWELNWQPFGSQARTQSTEPHQPGQILFIFRER